MKQILQIMAFGILFYVCCLTLLFKFVLPNNMSQPAILFALEPLLLVACISLAVLLRNKFNSLDLIKQEKNEIKLNLSKNKNLLEKILQNATIGMAVLNIRGQIIQLNDLFSNLTGIPGNKLMMMDFLQFLSLGGADSYSYGIELEKMRNHILNSFQTEMQWQNPIGELLYLDIQLSLVCDHLSEPIYFIVNVKNNTEQKKIKNQLAHAINYDSLTGIANRDGMYQLANELITNDSTSKRFILIATDVDKFNSIINVLGYDAGDNILKTVAERINKSISGKDFVARVSGDLFVIIVSNLKDREMVQTIIQKLTEAVTKPIQLDKQEIYITLSIGVSVYPEDGNNIKTLLKNAVIALQQAKDVGRNNYQLFSNEFTTIIDHDLALRTALNGSLLRNEFFLHYQPKLDLTSLKFTGVEAFLRWKNNQFQDVNSGEIIKIAIDSGLIIPVGEWVRQSVFEQLKRWQNMGLNDKTIAINCSLREIHQRLFADKIIGMCNELNIPPNLIEIEFAENDIMRDPKFILDVLYRLKNKGITVVIDDYGNGKCSLNYLKKLGLDKIKINTVYINQIQIDDISTTMITAIIDSANKIGIKTIAAKVENKEQFQFLRKLGCTEIQGYYVCEPINNSEITTYLLDEQSKVVEKFNSGNCDKEDLQS